MRGLWCLRERWTLVIIFPVLTLAVACEMQQSFCEASALCAGLDVIGGQGFVVPVLVWVAPHWLSAPPACVTVVVFAYEAAALLGVSPA